MRRVVILEGPDAGGKSTTAKWLHDTYGYQIVHTGPPQSDEDVVATYSGLLMTALRSAHLTVFDRLHTGEAIYGPLLRGVDKLGVHGRDKMDTLIRANDVVLIFCIPPWAALLAMWKSKDGDLLKQQEQLSTVRLAYLREARRLGLTPYDWTTPNAEEILKGLIEV